MLKIMTMKKWNNFNNEFIDLQLENADLKNDNANYKDQVDTIVALNEKYQNANNELSALVAETAVKLTDAKKEIRRLKTLCTKNKINYKEEKKECKTKKK